MTDRVTGAHPLAHLLGIGKQPKTAQPKPQRASAPPAPKPKAKAKAKATPKIHASTYSHLFVAPAAPERSATTRPVTRPTAPTGPQTSPASASAEAERRLAAQIIAAGRRRRGETG